MLSHCSQYLAQEWKDLGTTAGTLSADSSNVVELIKDNYEVCSLHCSFPQTIRNVLKSCDIPLSFFLWKGGNMAVCICCQHLLRSDTITKMSEAVESKSTLYVSYSME